MTKSLIALAISMFTYFHTSAIAHAGVAQAYPGDKYVGPSSPLVRERLEWFKDQKLCLMMHFGLYSIWGLAESWPLSTKDAFWARTDVEWTNDDTEFKRQYWALSRFFNPVRFNAQRKFPEIAYFLKRFQRELFPVEVDGDVLYGLNVTPSGWWLWAFNNKGITNFTDEYPTLDANAKSDIRVRLRGISAKSVRELVSERDIALDGDTFAATVPAGDLAIFELKR